MFVSKFSQNILGTGKTSVKIKLSITYLKLAQGKNLVNINQWVGVN